jgi:uncharacterized phage protein (TIGR02218 family)
MIDLTTYNGDSKLLDFFNTRPASMLCADLYSITPRPGLYSPAGTAILRYTSSLYAISLGGNVYSPGPPNFERGTLRCETGLQSSETEIGFQSDDSVLLDEVPLLARLARGEWNFATFKIERAYSAGPGSAWLGRAPRFLGIITDIQDIGRITAKLTVKNVSYLLDTQWPKDTIMSTCCKVLYGTDCGVTSTTYQVSGTVSAAGTVNGFKTSLTEADDYFNGGTVTFTSGDLAGLSYWVRTFVNTNGVVRLQTPAMVAPSSGDAFTILPGCDKSMSMCKSRFANFANYGGYPDVPQPTTAY